MPFSSGTFSVFTPGNPVVTGTTISSTVFNNTMTDFATGLSACMLRDGSQAISSNIPMSSFKFTGLAAGTSAGDSVRYEQVFTSQSLTDAATISWGITAPKATVTLTASRTMAAPTNQSNGGRYSLVVTQDGTGTWSLTWNAVFKAANGGTMPQPNPTAAAVSVFDFVSDGTNMYCVQCMPFIDTNYIVQGSADTSKKVRMEVDGLTTATTRVLTVGDQDTTIGCTQTQIDAGTAVATITANLNKLSLGTPLATTSGTAQTFTGLPTGIRRITMNLTGVSLSGTDNLLLQIGPSGGLETTGYVSSSIIVVSAASSGTAVTSTSGIILNVASAAVTVGGRFILELENSSTNTWVCTFHGLSSSNNIPLSCGTKSLAGVLSQISLTRTGTDTFDAGEINIIYER